MRRARNPEKVKAQNALNYAVRMGRLVRGSCEGCGTDKKVHAHHDDYSKPFQVRWLCYLCHKSEHPVDEEDKRSKFEHARRADVEGTNNPNAKLTEQQVNEIREYYKSGISQEEIANAFSVSQVTISRVVRGERYSSVPYDPCRTAPG